MVIGLGVGIGLRGGLGLSSIGSQVDICGGGLVRRARRLV